MQSQKLILILLWKDLVIYPIVGGGGWKPSHFISWGVKKERRYITTVAIN
jgi:hypothetical protein